MRFYGIKVSSTVIRWFEPQPDITTHELATITGMLAAIGHVNMIAGRVDIAQWRNDHYDRLPAECQRHFVAGEVPPPTAKNWWSW